MGFAVQAMPASKMQGGVWDVVQWAFAAERASVDFDQVGAAPCGIDTIWLLMQRGRLGCKIDGGRQGGGAQSADDAEIVAGIVAALPVAHGGRGMAVRIAEMARAGLTPEFYPDATPRVIPLATRRTRHGVFSVTEDARDMRFAGHGRFRCRETRACPVRIVPTAQQIGAARRFYLDWIGALMHIRHELSRAGLARWDLSDELPPMAPWRSLENNA